MNFDKLIETGKAILRKHGSHNTEVILIKDGKASMYSLLFSNLEEKRAMQDSIRKIVSIMKPEKFYVITDSWITLQDMKKPDMPGNITPRQRKDRKEALVFIEFNKDMTGKHATIIYERLGKRIKFQKPIISDFKDMAVNHSQFNFYLEKEGIQEGFNNQENKVTELFLKNMSKEISDKYKDEFFAEKTEEGRMNVLKKIIAEGLKKREEINEKILPPDK